MMGKMVPYKALGFQSPYDLVLSCPEVVEVQQLAAGHNLLVAVPDEKTEHMARMVGTQLERRGPSGYNYRTSEVVATLSQQERKNIQKVSRRRSRAVPGLLRDQVEQMMDEVEEHRAELDYRGFLAAYHNMYDYPLEVQTYGFYNLDDFLHHGLGASVTLRPDRAACWRIFPGSAPAAAPPAVPAAVRDGLRRHRGLRPADGVHPAGAGAGAQRPRLPRHPGALPRRH